MSLIRMLCILLCFPVRSQPRKSSYTKVRNIILGQNQSSEQTGIKSQEESNSAANSNGRKFLYNSKGLDVISLLVKY